MIDFEYFAKKGIDYVVDVAPMLLLAIVVLFVGLRVIKGAVKLLNKGFEKKNTDTTLRPFIISLVSIGLKAMLFISIASMLSIETTSFVAVLGAAGLAVGLALQGTLANFAGGVLILLFKPFKVGDLVEAQGHFGEILEIQIFVTKITTPNNQVAIIPNGILSNGSLINYSALGKIRVDLTIGISYDADIRKAKEILLEAMNKDSKTLKDPAPFVGVSELGDSSVNLAVRPWATPTDYWDVYFDTLENCKIALDNAGITIPFPQTDVHLFQPK